GAAVVQALPGLLQAVTESTPTSGLSAGMVPSRLTRRILPLPLFKQLAYLLVGGVALEPVSPTATYRWLSCTHRPPPSWLAGPSRPGPSPRAAPTIGVSSTMIWLSCVSTPRYTRCLSS